MACILGDHKVTFQYHTNSKKKRTICKITDQNNVEISVAETKLHKHDDFDKKVGRTIAFKRAMSEANLPKEIKSQIWNDFRNKVGQAETTVNIK